MAAQTVNYSMNADDIFNPVYCAVATGVATSQTNTDPRGGTWTSRTMPVSSAWQSVDYGNGILCAVSSTSGTIAATSVDGTTWVQRVLPTTTTWQAVKYGEIGVAGKEQFVAVSNAGNYAATSPDGATWTAQTISGSTYAWTSLAYGNGVWVALANASEANTLRTAVTSDGITWSNNNTTSITCPGTWSSIFFANGRFIALCSGSTVAAYSTDGITWTQTGVLPASTTWISLTSDGNGIWIAVTSTDSANAARSTDNGDTWSQITFPASSTWRSVIYGKNIIGEGVFAGIGATTVGNYSIDGGVTWAAKAQVTMTYTSACYAPFKWYSSDTLTITGGATVTVDTDQDQFWATMAITNGKLKISNSSTSTGITFAMGRNSGSTAGTITPGSGLGSIEIDGDWIELGTGNGSSSQTLTAPYTDYIPAVWVQTSSGSTSYEQWLNVTGAYGDGNTVMYEGLNAVGNGERGKFFVQGATASPYGPLSLYTSTGNYANLRATRYLKVNDTTGILPGAQIFGAGLTANTVVNRVLSSTELELHLPTAYPVRTDWSGIAYGGSGGTTFVAISKQYSDISAYSTDGGVTWTQGQMPFKAEWSSICWGATSGRFVAVTRGTNKCATSTDGISWTTQYMPTTMNYNAVATNGTSYVAVGATTADAATTAAAYSADGLTWVAATMATSAIYRCAAYGNSQYIAIAQTGIINYDADGAGTWTAGTSLTSATYIAVVWNGSRFVAISGSNTTTRYSTTGTGAWSNGGALPNSTFTSMCWTGSVFVATSTSSTLAQTAVTSTDGAAWTNRSLGVNQWSAICFGGTTTVAVAGSNATNFAGSTASTSDATGVTWTNRAGMVSNVVFTCFNPYRSQLTNQLTFGNGVNGNVIPSGYKVRCPNIMVTSFAPANLHTVDNKLGCSFVLTNGGKVSINTALFDEAYHNFGQAQNLEITDAAFSVPFVVTECYDVTLTRVAFALQPVRRYWTSPYWYSRELRYGQNSAWNYINGAIVTDLKSCVGSPFAQYSSTTATGPITLSYTDNATFTRLYFYSLNPIKANQTGIFASSMVTNCTFDDCRMYGVSALAVTTSSNNEFTNLTVAPRMFSGKMGMGTSGTRIGIDPATGTGLVNGTKYYFKVRSYRDWTDLTNYVEGPVVSATPFVGSKWYPPRFSAVATAATIVTLNWTRRDPTSASTVAYEIYRGTSPNFTKNAAAIVYTSATVATVTRADTVVDGNTYYYMLRKYDGALTGITNSSGTGGTFIVTTSQNFNTGLGSIANCQGTIGTRKVRIPSGSASNFLATLTCVGMPIAGGGLAAGTTITSVDNELEITVSADIDSTFTGSTLTLGAIAGMYVRGTGIAAATKVVSVDSTTQITVDTALTGSVSGTLTFLYATDGEEVEVYASGAKQTASNLLFQSNDFTNASWVKTNITTAAAAFFGPSEVAFNASSTAPTALGVSLLSTAPGANMAITQAGLSASTSYCFSMYIMAPPNYLYGNAVSCTISIDTTVPTTSTFNTSGKWQRISVPFTSTATSHTITFTINNNGALVYPCSCQINAGSTPTVPVTTTTAAVTLNPVVQEITSAYAWGRTTGGTAVNQGIELVVATAPTGTHYSNIFMGTSSGFIPSVDNLVDCTIAATWNLVSITTSQNNTVETITQEEKGQTGVLIYLAGASESQFLNIDYDFGFGTSSVFSIQNLSNNNLFHNFTISKFRNYIASTPLVSVNNASGLIFQNIYLDTFDTPFLVNSLDVVLKGISGAHAEPTESATTYALGGTLDGIGVANVTVYDTNFHEFYHSPTTGALNLIFNDSSKTSKPYTILSGIPTFSNTGKLYLQTSGDSIEFTWPHFIKGVTSFRNIKPKLNGLDLGTAVDNLTGVLVEFAISNNGTTYTDYLEATGPNLAAASITSATTGFKLKIRLTCRLGMKYTAQTNPFVINEQIRGASSAATAYVRLNNNLGTTGDILVDTVVGTFIAGEAIVRASDSQARSTNLATNTNFALFPSFTSYIDGLQLFTNVDTSIHYPVLYPTLTITGLQAGSQVDVMRVSDEVRLGGTTSTGTSYDFTYEYTTDTAVYIVVQSYGYLYLRTEYTLTAEDSSLPIQQTIDRQYENPVG